jgi:hypothetical protein
MIKLPGVDPTLGTAILNRAAMRSAERQARIQGDTAVEVAEIGARTQREEGTAQRTSAERIAGMQMEAQDKRLASELRAKHLDRQMTKDISDARMQHEKELQVQIEQLQRDLEEGRLEAHREGEDKALSHQEKLAKFEAIQELKNMNVQLKAISMSAGTSAKQQKAIVELDALYRRERKLKEVKEKALLPLDQRLEALELPPGDVEEMMREVSAVYETAGKEAGTKEWIYRGLKKGKMKKVVDAVTPILDEFVTSSTQGRITNFTAASDDPNVTQTDLDILVYGSRQVQKAVAAKLGVDLDTLTEDEKRFVTGDKADTELYMGHFMRDLDKKQLGKVSRARLLIATKLALEGIERKLNKVKLHPSQDIRIKVNKATRELKEMEDRENLLMIDARTFDPAGLDTWVEEEVGKNNELIEKLQGDDPFFEVFRQY